MGHIQAQGIGVVNYPEDIVNIMKWLLCAVLLFGPMLGWAEDTNVVSRGDLDLRVGVQEEEEQYPPLVYKSQDGSGGCHITTRGNPGVVVLSLFVVTTLVVRRNQCRI